MRTAFELSNIVSDERVIPPSQAIVDYLFDFTGPKFLFDDIYHFSLRHYKRHQNNRNMLPVVKLMLSTVLNHTLTQKAPLLIVPEAITNGHLYYDLAEKHAPRIKAVRGGDLTTYRLGEILNKGELTALTDKNKNRAMTRLEGFQKLFPTASAISPTGMEAMLQCLTSEPGFRNYQMLRDEDFEAFWIGVCMASQIGGFSDEVAYSRNGNFETFALFQVRYGLVPFRPKADTEIFFPNQKPVTPFDYMQMLFSHMLDVVPRGFTTDLSVKMAVRMMMLEEMRVKKWTHPVWGKLDPKTMNPDLAALPPAHTKDFNTLKREIIFFMAEHNLGCDLADKNGLDGYDGLEEFYHDKIQEIGPIIKGVRRHHPERYEAHNAENLDMESALKKKDFINSQNFQIPYQLEGDFFSSEPAIFNENHFDQCDHVEQLALRTFMGLLETPKMLPAERFQDQGGIFLLIDRRGGEAAAAFAGNSGILLPFEARGLSSSFQPEGFDETVKPSNIAKTARHAGLLQSLYPKSFVTTLEHIEEDAENFRLNRKAFVAPGADRLSPAAKLAYGEEILRRLTRLAVFDRSWENSALLLGLRMQARKIQLGLVDRPSNLPRNSMIIGNVTDNEKVYIAQSLADDLQTLTAEVRRLACNNIEDFPRPLIKALLETISLVSCYYSEEANSRAKKGDHGLIDWQSVPMAAKARLESDKSEIVQILAEAKNLILAHGVNALSLPDVMGDVQNIDPDYKNAREDLDARQRILRSRKTRLGSYQAIKGFNAA